MPDKPDLEPMIGGSLMTSPGDPTDAIRRQAVAHNIQEQDVMRELIAESRIPALEIDVSDGDLGSICHGIADWLEETDGLRFSG